jgi:hypothetical protein
VKESLLQRCQEVEQTAREQAADNAILDQLCKVLLISKKSLVRLYFFETFCWCLPFQQGSAWLPFSSVGTHACTIFVA